MAHIINEEKPDAVVHLGDYVYDARELMDVFPMLPIYSIRGNNDYGCREPFNAAITPDNVPIYITHGHREGVYFDSFGRVAQSAREDGCALAFFGHTHQMFLQWDRDVLVCNPGSISMPREGVPGYARLTIEDGHAIMLELLDDEGALLRMEKIKN